MRVVDLHAHWVPAGVGVKAARLHWLARRGYRVPRAFSLIEGSGGSSLEEMISPDVRYAVRSSANLEDGRDHSFAGQFHTELDVAASEVPAAAERVRQSTGDDRVLRYLNTVGIDPASIEMAVVVQEMAQPVVSGVVFSRNPMTGLSETIVEAVLGRGDALVADGITPHRWVFRWGDCIDSPAESILGADVVTTIVKTAADIEEAFGAPVDLEWVWDGKAVQWVQLRAITGLDSVDVYSNRIAKEVLPGIIKPLVWSVNVPLVNSAWIELFTEAIGDNDLRPEDLARAFAYRAYFNMGAIGDIFEALGMPRETLELLLGFEGSAQPSFKPTRQTLPRLPRMTLAALRKVTYGHRVEKLLTALDADLRRFTGASPADMGEEELLADVDALYEIVRGAAYANIVVPLLMNAYYGALRKRLEAQDVDITRIEIKRDEETWTRFDPAVALDRLHARFDELPAADRRHIASAGYAALQSSPDGLLGAVDDFMRRFGHFSDSGNDFSVVPWREDPDHVVQMIVGHRPAGAAGTRIQWTDVVGEAGPLARLVLNGWYRRARDFKSYRDAVSFEYTRGYGLFRERFLELGEHFAADGRLSAAEDIWYLELDEIRRLVAGETIAAAELAAARKAEIESLRDVALPEVIFGNEFVPAPAPEAVGGLLRGIPTSRGVYRGPVRVVLDRNDFAQVQEGDVLVIPFSDVGWTPLFARAGAVVAESGGILSHSSIVAREYGIPCVVSVPHACRIESGVVAVVDGYAGTVTLESAEG